MSISVQTHIISYGKRPRHLVAHAGVIHGHEDGVDDDAEGDEQVNEGVHDEQLDEAGELVPTRTTLPAEQQQHQLLSDYLLRCFRLPIRDTCKRTLWELNHPADLPK